MAPKVRELGFGIWSVDYGRKWFRLRADGQITAREACTPPGEVIGHVCSREPTKAEINAVRRLVNKAKASRT